ncbi:4Fe4S-binding SPASM domain containing protein [Desulfovibrio sp. X2]|uniref:radical SAM/SPASM domain-containing protein n=1 Tax=Desulfovibrio sp. X2 TaxID=941449 RepID=UPI000358F11F|nr:SPASM domain-containing protein [Desulfovibrio sp. X2]EPR39796.1 4Fe4S-binding SPASM domain containing protein [Desulfovibrio sp. X2]
MLPVKLEKFGFDIVHGCQLRCVGCPNSTLAPKIRHVLPEDFAACLDNLDVAEVKLMRLFNFGEPLLHPDVPGLLRLIPGRSFSVRTVEISTNAQHHDFAMLEEIFRTGVLGKLVVSCDGDGTPAEYERLRTPAKWEKLVAFLAKAGELRNAYAPGVRLHTRTICETDEGRRRWLDTLTPLGWDAEFRVWLTLPGSKDNPSGREVRAQNGLCEYMQRRTLYVDSDGTVVTCCVHPQAGIFGNLRHEKYSAIYKGAERTAFLKSLKTGRAAMPVCGRCEERPHRNKLQKLADRLSGGGR